MRCLLFLSALLWSAPVLACDFSIGDWQLEKGDVTKVRESLKTKIVSFDLSEPARRKLTKLSERYLNQKLPMRVAAYSIEPVVHTPLYGVGLSFNPKTREESQIIKDELSNCI